ncbi:MAG: hypothetical protein ACI97N_000836 [Cognaticolwellia sp.]|jgi:hypothetical protein|tara:strand:- start:839 stop:1060 length:222 start_codon:yes stop_codon:yes gene_type:complete
MYLSGDSLLQILFFILGQYHIVPKFYLPTILIPLSLRPISIYPNVIVKNKYCNVKIGFKTIFKNKNAVYCEFT